MDKIKMPSNKVIKKRAEDIFRTVEDVIAREYSKLRWIQGAKWMRNKIKRDG